MKNRQSNTDNHTAHPNIDACHMHNTNQQICQLNTYSDMPYHTQKKINEQPLLNGLFRFYEFNNGLSMHISDATEQQNAHSTLELMPCVSINIILIGSLSYTLNGEKFTLTTDNTAAKCSALILPKKEIITRHIRKGQKIKKINICFDHKWLKKRCTNNNEYNTLLRGKKCLYQWQATQEQTDLALALIQMENKVHQHTLFNITTREYKIIHLASSLLNSLLNASTNILPAIYSPDFMTSKKNIDFIEKIKRTSINTKNKLSLNTLAEENNISVSTLQRRFKSYCGITVNEYIRTSRLEQAKKSIITDGKSIGEAAYIAGYNHSSNFVTAFKRHFHTTPKELIKSHKK